MSLASAGPLAGQREFAHTSSARQARFQANSLPWFEAGLERVEFELGFDVELARSGAAQLARLADEAGEPAVAAVARELEALAAVEETGPARVEHAPAQLPTGTSAVLRTHFHLARARRLAHSDLPTDVLADALAALDAARESGAAAPILRAAWFLHDITEDEALDLDAAVIAEIERHSHTGEALAFEALRRMTEYWRAWSSLSTEGRHAALDAAEQAADAVGDVRGLVQVEWDRAVLWSESRDLPRAVERLERARELARAASFLREEAVSLQILADLALAAGDLELARTSTAESAELVAGSGMIEPEIRQAHLALRLASASEDVAAIVECTARLEELRRSSARRRDEYVAVRQHLFAAELARAGLERTLAETRARTQRLMVAGSAVALLLLVLLATFGLRRLARTNRRLREEVLRAEGESRTRAELEKRLRLIERAESLGLIASGVAHDFNNLMAGVLGNAELLRLYVKDPESARHLDAIAESVERGTRLCRQLQTYAGGEPAAFERVDLGALLDTLAPPLCAAAGARIALELEPVPEELATEADRAQLEQALLNLVTNARDASARRIRVRARRSRRTASDWAGEFHRGDARAGEFLCVEVEDDGEGLSAELLERIFDPFFTTRFPGRGLGLAVVLGAVRRHHGAITVASRPGAGACFRLYLPVIEGAARAVVTPRPAPAKPAPHGLPLHVLVIDDEPQVCAFVRTTLEARGHRVVAAQDGARAAELLDELDGERCVALIDLSMPVLDGRDIVQALRARGRAPAIVLMSGHATTHLAEVARELAADGHIAKPFLSGPLEEVLTDALDHHLSSTRPLPLPS